MEAEICTRLVCPTCLGAIALETFQANDGDVETGVLLCARCRAWYPIAHGIPVLLDFRTDFHERFARDHSSLLARLGDWSPPAGTPRPGEQSVQRTFTEEWTRSRESELSFTHSEHDLAQLQRRVWLAWATSPEERGRLRSVLEVGCGLGGETRGLRAALDAPHIFAVDLNLGLLESPIAREAPPGVHFLIASLFALPFAPSSFDLVYSQGVLHHTFSTEAAFRAVAGYAAPAGYLFIWVYGIEDHLAAKGRRRAGMRAGVAVERLVRPLVSRSPTRARNAFFAVSSRLAHPLLKPRMRHADQWHRVNTDTYLRDWLSPRYAHRHAWNEVIEWYEREGFEVVAVQSAAAYRDLFGWPLWGVGLTGRRAGLASDPHAPQAASQASP